MLSSEDAEKLEKREAMKSRMQAHMEKFNDPSLSEQKRGYSLGRALRVYNQLYPDFFATAKGKRRPFMAKKKNNS